MAATDRARHLSGSSDWRTSVASRFGDFCHPRRTTSVSLLSTTSVEARRAKKVKDVLYYKLHTPLSRTLMKDARTDLILWTEQ